MKKKTKMARAVLIVSAALIALLAAVYVNHRIRLAQEESLRTPLGMLVDVDGHKMSVYAEGHGDKTLVFLSGGGTCSPILDFKSLYSSLTDQYQAVVIEKFGYGSSDVVDKARDIDSILADTRAALAGAGIEGPYVLCPHSMSGIEALYWVQQYPDEVEAIIGLDMALPDAYEEYDVHLPLLRISQLAARIGLTRILPGVSESDAIRHGTLTDAEKEIYRAVFYEKTATSTMLSEVQHIKENAKAVQRGGTPQVPMLLFVSNGSGTGWDEAAWRSYPVRYLEDAANSRLVALDCPHYVHDYAYETISAEIKSFLPALPDHTSPGDDACP